jgi:hypothetical protein
MVKRKIQSRAGRGGVQLVFADESLRLLCSTQELLVRAFGPAWRSVAHCLKILEVAETLADLAAFAAIVVYQVLQTVEGALEFVITYAAIQLRVRTLAPIPQPGTRHEDREGLALVRAVSVLSVALSPAVIGA